ncbi:hypothetical protein MIR68_008133 [Amoeboaphelidium protococcarum]|nr:hypothetical protein MIR68_008133 [Amoeboaphelidium protococcarum]
MKDQEFITVYFDLVQFKEECEQIIRRKSEVVQQDASLTDLCKVVAETRNLPEYVISDMKIYFDQSQFENGVECPSSFTVQDLQSAGYGSLENRIVITVPDRNLLFGNATFSSLKGPISEFEDYQRVAQLMLDCDIVQNVEQKVQDLYSGGIELPFIFIEGSSGCGKSQLAMSLYYKSLLPNSARKVYYLNCVTYKLSTQNIYRYFESPSALFMKCIDSDFNAKVSPSESRNQLLGNKLYVFDFIRQLLFDDIYGKQAEVQVKKFQGTELASLVSSKFDASNRPVVILDEFLPRTVNEDSSNEKLLKFIRNCFLTVGIIVGGLGFRAIYQDAGVCPLRPEGIAFDELKLQNWDLIDEFAHIVVPFYSAPGAKWPDFILNCKEFNCRNWDRTVNTEMVDAIGTLKEIDRADSVQKTTLLQAEAKCWSTPINLEQIKKVIKRIRYDSEISLVVGTTFQGTYFNRKTIQNFVEEEKLDLFQCKFLKLLQQKDTLSFRSVDGLSDWTLAGEKRGSDGAKIYKQLVVLIEIGPFS